MKNREFRRSFAAFLAGTALFTAVGFLVSPQCGGLVFVACGSLLCVFVLSQYFRSRRLKRLSADLDRLLHDGLSLPIQAYAEGETSVLANQIQKMTLRLTEAADLLQSDKTQLADAMANISHQLRTPLTAMNLTASMLSDPNLPGERRQALTGEMKTLLSRTEWLVEALLKLSKLDAGTVKLASKPVCVRELISLAAGPLMIPMELREQQLTVVCGEERFTGDLTWTAEALGNILKNCVEHTPDRGRITVTAQETALFTALTVADTGPGFLEEELPRLFERFYKGSSASENSYGIGLALARTIITAQNGTIQAANAPKGGAVFTIKFYKQII